MSAPWQPGHFGPGQPLNAPAPEYPVFVASSEPGPPQSTTPSGATAIIAAVLSLLGCVAMVAQAVLSWYLVSVWGATPIDGSSDSPQHYLVPFDIAMGVVQAIVAATLLTGGALLITGRSSGRWIVIASCAATVLANAIGLIYVYTVLNDLDVTFYERYRYSLRSVRLSSTLLTVVPMTFALITGVLAALKSTAAWCRFKHDNAQVASHGSYPGYPQPY
jgi:hypothetical protein